MSAADPSPRVTRAWPLGRAGGETGFILALVALALALRIPGMAESLWHDEIWSTSIMLNTPRNTAWVILADVHPPLYSAIMWLWIHLFGDSEVSVRTVPLMAGLVSIPLTHLVVKERCGEAAGLIAATLVAFSPTHIWYSQEARSYGLLLALVLISVWSFDRASGGAPRTRWLALYAISAFSIVFLHYYSIAYVGLLAIAALLRPSQARVRMVAISAAAIAAILIFVAAKWAAFGMITEAGHVRPLSFFELWVVFFDWFLTGGSLRFGFSIWDARFAQLIEHPGLLAAYGLVAALFAAGLVAAIRAHGRLAQSGPLDLVALTLAVPLLLFVLTLLGFKQVSIQRSYLSAMPYFFGIVGFGLVSLRPRVLRAVATCALVSLVLVAQVAFRVRTDEWTVYKPNPDWRAAAAYLGPRMEQADGSGLVIWVSPALALRYYDRRFAYRGELGPGARQEGPVFSDLRVRDPQALELDDVDGPVFVIRNIYWQANSAAVIARLEAMPSWVKVEQHDVKGLQILTFERAGPARDGPAPAPTP